MGGLSRRASIIEEYRKTDGQVLVVEAGNFAAKTPKVSQGSLPQQRIKAKLQMEAFALSQTDVIGVGEKDLGVGVDWFFTEALRYELPIIASNLECETGTLAKKKEFIVDGLHIHFYSLINATQKIAGCTISPYARALNDLEIQPNTINVLLSQLPKDQLDEVIDKYNFDIVVDAKIGKKLNIPDALDSDTVLLATGTKGKYVGYSQMLVDDPDKGFRHAKTKDSIEAIIKKNQRRIQNLEGKSSSPSNEKKIKFYRNEVEYYSAKKDALDAAPAVNQIENKLIPLDRNVEDWPGLSQSVQQATDEITAIITGKKENNEVQ